MENTSIEPDPQKIMEAVAKQLPKKYYILATIKLVSMIPYIRTKWKHAVAFNKKKFTQVIFDMFHLIWKHYGITVMFHGKKVFVDEYFSERLHEKEHKVEEYMLEREAAHIFWMSSSHDIAKMRQIDNKTSGYEFLQKNHLPTTNRYGILKSTGEQIIWESTNGDTGTLMDLMNIHHKVFIKPDNDGIGRGCAILEKGENGGLLINKQHITERHFAQQLKRHLLVEEIVTQIPECAEWHPGSLNTLRLITMRNSDTKELYIERAIYRMGVGDAPTDNWCTGGIGVKVHPNGELDKYGYFCDPVKAPCTVHPDTEKLFEGAILTHYKEAAQLVLKAHKLVKRINGIGWDIAFTERGPIIIEMNPFFSVFQAQCGGLRTLIEKQYLKQAQKNYHRWKDLAHLLS